MRRPSLGDVIPLTDSPPDEVLRLAATAEQRSEHLIARLIVKEAHARHLPLAPVHDFTAHPGAGIVVSGPAASHVVDAHHEAQPIPPISQFTSHESRFTISVGNRRLMDQLGVTLGPEAIAALESLDASGQTPLVVAVDGRAVGVIGVRDTVRPEAHDVIHELHHVGLSHFALLTGDRRPVAAEVARAVGIDQFEAELLPQEKAEWLARWKAEGKRVGMVGDGVNDAPALASADVGLALGGVGTDIAAEAGDIVLMGDPLRPLPSLIRLARQTVRIIRQNIIAFAFGVNLVGIIFSIYLFPYLGERLVVRDLLGPDQAKRLAPIGAAVFHQLGSLAVLLNAMRLLWFESWGETALGRVGMRLTAAADTLAAWLNPEALAASLWRHRRRAALVAVAIAAVIYAGWNFVTIGPDERAAVTRFGRWQTLLDPGLHFCLPPPFETVWRLQPNRLRVVELGFRSRPPKDAVALPPGLRPGPIEWTSPHADGRVEHKEDEALILTSDEVMVEMGATVQYRVKDVHRYLFGVRDPDAALVGMAECTLRELISRQPLNRLLAAGRSALEKDAAGRLQLRADQYGLGLEVTTVLLQDVHPPLPVVAAFREVSSALEDRQRMQNEAEGYAKEQTNLAQGEAAAEVNAAQQYDFHRRAVAEGDAQQFSLRAAAYHAAPDLTAFRLYWETLETVLAGKQKLVIDPKAAGRRHLFLADPDRFNLAPAAPALINPPRSRGETPEEP